MDIFPSVRQAKISALRRTGGVSSFLRRGAASLTALFRRLYLFYRQGFRSMVLGRSLWKIVALKLFIIFAVLKIFFFPNYLASHFDNERDRAGHVLENLTGPPSAR